MKFCVDQEIKYLIKLALEKAGILCDVEIGLEHPGDEEHGDFSTNIALKLFKNYQLPITNYQSNPKSKTPNIKTPRELAELIVNNFPKSDLLEKVEVAGPGFINFFLAKEYLIKELKKIEDEKTDYGKNDILNGKKILLEHTSPNPQTTIMLGHLRNNFLGMAVANILTFEGAKVVKDCIVNDRGVHICRSMWGYLAFAKKDGGLTKEELLNFKDIAEEKIKDISEKFEWREKLTDWMKNPSSWWIPEELGLKPDHANLIWYVLGSRTYKLLPMANTQVDEILKSWEKEDKNVRNLWKLILSWSAVGYAQTYKRVRSEHNFVWHESDHWKQGVEIVDEGLKKGIFVKSEGAIVTNLEKYKLPDTVVVKSNGTALYITQDLALTKMKMEKFPSDKYIWDIGLEQSAYFKQLFAVMEQLGIAKREQLLHLSYALINFKGGGKMATRKGDVVKADEILDLLHERALEIIKSSRQDLRGKLEDKELNELAEKVAVGAIKYSLLKYGRETTMFFDINESLSLEGDSGSYLMYAFARTRSIAQKASNVIVRSPDLIGTTKQSPQSRLLRSFQSLAMTDIELSLLRWLYRFPEVVLEAGENFAPNLICNYLFNLVQKYNLFYNKVSILNARLRPDKIGTSSSAEATEDKSARQAENDIQSFRLMLNDSVGMILKNGLNLLGIEAVERM